MLYYMINLIVKVHPILIIYNIFINIFLLTLPRWHSNALKCLPAGGIRKKDRDATACSRVGNCKNGGCFGKEPLFEFESCGG